MNMAELIGSILVLLGALFHFSAGVGMLRMPDAYTRMQAGTKASTLGNTLILAGLAFYHPGWTLKLGEKRAIGTEDPAGLRRLCRLGWF
jgi:multicomponent Na+:H+ antiporter subunit G